MCPPPQIYLPPPFLIKSETLCYLKEKDCDFFLFNLIQESEDTEGDCTWRQIFTEPELPPNLAARIISEEHAPWQQGRGPRLGVLSLLETMLSECCSGERRAPGRGGPCIPAPLYISLVTEKDLVLYSLSFLICKMEKLAT